MDRKILWVIAFLMATMALVAGCVNVNVPKGPYVSVGPGANPPTPEDVNRVKALDRAALEAEDLRLASDNDYMRQLIERQKRDIKELKDKVKQLEKEVKDLQK
jgi:peptidoglycan hydrolase CwlO-like protein